MGSKVLVSIYLEWVLGLNLIATVSESEAFQSDTGFKGSRFSRRLPSAEPGETNGDVIPIGENKGYYLISLAASQG